ncbi:MAG: hypothetical protein OXI44_12830 [Bacteroidota bacterium]|nr:hypothetical protein [Bacteroidota bacterium]
MNIIDLLRKRKLCKGVFTLPSGELVKGRIILDPKNDHFIVLQVNRPQGSWTLPPDFKEIAMPGKLDDGTPVTLIGSSPVRSKYLSFDPCYDINCQSLFTGDTPHPVQIHNCEVTQVRFNLTRSRKIFPFYMDQVSPEKRHEILRTIIGNAYQPNKKGYSFDRIYYCGRRAEVISCNTNYGRVSVRPYDVTTLPYIDVEFVMEPNLGGNLSDAEGAIECVTRFFWLITGSRQYAEKIRMVVRGSEDGVTRNLDAHFLLQEAPLFTPDTAQDSINPLIDPIKDREMFEKCLSAWSSLTEIQRAACDVRLSHFNEPIHSPFRIARDAVAYEWYDNTSEDASKRSDNESTRLKKEIVKFANNRIRDEFDDTNERHFVLTNLGEIPERRTLRDKINSRLCIIRKHLPEEIKDNIDSVVDKAVKARNEYIHVQTYMLSEQAAPCYMYMANSLEFIFLSSVLVECGWEMKKWVKSFNTLLHPFSSYIADYSQLCDLCIEPKPKD